MSDQLPEYLRLSPDELEERWNALVLQIKDQFTKEAGIEAILFLIGIQSRGLGYRPNLSKKRKQDLIMEGTYCAFETLGLYKRVGKDDKGHITWERTEESLPKLPLPDQETLLKVAILSYFEANY